MWGEFYKYKLKLKCVPLPITRNDLLKCALQNIKILDNFANTVVIFSSGKLGIVLTYDKNKWKIPTENTVKANCK